MLKQFYNKREVIEITGLCNSTIWKLIKKGSFPASLPKGGINKAFWAAEEVDAWVERRKHSGAADTAEERAHARAMGWLPEEEWREGVKPRKFVSAKEFLKGAGGETVNPPPDYAAMRERTRERFPKTLSKLAK